MLTAIEQLAERGRVEEALGLLRGLSNPSVELRVLHAELEAISANPNRAYALAQDVAQRGAASVPVVRALVVSGYLSFVLGRHAEGHLTFAKARDLAARLNDAGCQALAIGRHVEALMRYVSLEAAIGDIGAYRRAAIRAGKPSTLAAMHRVLAEAELKAGRGNRALKELELCALHVEGTPDIIARAQLHIAKSAALGLLGDVRLASDEAKQAIELLKHSGAHTFLRTAQVNTAHCMVLLGDRSGASELLDHLLEAFAAFTNRTLDVRANQLMLATASLDSIRADAIDVAGWEIASSRDSVNAKWYGLTRIEYLRRFRRLDEATALGRQLLSDARQADRHFVGYVQMATAESLATQGRYRDAAELLRDVSTGQLGGLQEFGALTQKVSARIATDTLAASIEHFSRAERIFGSIGHFVGRAESLFEIETLRASLAVPGSDAATVPHITTFYAPPPTTFGRVDAPSDATPTTTPDAVSSAVRAAAAMVDLTSRPALAGYELLSLVASSEAAATSVLLAKKGDRTSVLGWTGSDAPDDALRTGAGADELVTIALGTERDREVSVVVKPRNQQSARTTLLALQRLVGHGLTLHHAAVAESEKSAIWPEPLPEQQLGFVCASESMLDLLAVTRRVANSPLTVLITGETGTGKELLAHAVHKCSPRAKQRFTPFNCTAVSRDMLDSQLFGYRKGAFTGAVDAFPGVIRGAAGGTLFLDEIGEIGMDVQPKLLRFLESSDVHPLGEASPVKVDVRIVAATNANLDRLVAEGKFREDLYYRLNVVKLTIPPLRERREEIPLLLDHFLERTQRETSKSGIRIGDTTSEYLLLYDWPGNVRELANEVRRAVAMAESGAVLMPEHLSPRIAASRRTVPVGQRPPAPTELLVRRDQPLTAAVEHVERAMIMDALRVYSNVEDAARALGLSRKGLYLKRQRLKIDEV